jgi:phage terminase large subunit-like protein
MSKPLIEPIIIKPQPGPQEMFLSSPADIVIYGGAAGGGKTYGILIDQLRDIHVPGYGGVIFRREGEMITNEGGLWDEAMQIYPLFGGVPNRSKLYFRFPNGNKLGFDGLQHVDDVLKHQGSQIPNIGFDELTHFEESQFWYMLSRNRSKCGVRPRIRATLNPDPNCWVFKFLAAWVDKDYKGVKAKSGEIRYFTRVGGRVEWHDSQVEGAISVTFIAAKLSDNPALMKADPGYMDRLKALPAEEQARLLDGDWSLFNFGTLFKPWMFEDRFITPDKCPRLAQWYRGWDTATSANNYSDDTATLRVGRDPYGNVYLRGFASDKLESYDLNKWGAEIIERDGPGVYQVIEASDAGYGISGYMQNRPAWANMIKLQTVKSKGDKRQRATPLAMRAAEKKVYIVMEGDWEKAYDSLINFTGDPRKNENDHYVDAASIVDTYLKESKGKHEQPKTNPTSPVRKTTKQLFSGKR